MPRPLEPDLGNAGVGKYEHLHSHLAVPSVRWLFCHSYFVR